MCYDVASRTKSDLRYAKLRTTDEALIEALTRRLENLEGKPLFHTQGQAHQKLLIFTNEKPLEPQMVTWGLIPVVPWIKTFDDAKKFWNNLLNARGETIWEKPSFKNSAKNKRCLIYIDAFYEHHHLKSKTFPFHIALRSGEPMVMAGLWDEWVNKETGEVWDTVTIVTTKANSLMAKIHNNPKLEEGPRMPVILPPEKQEQWLAPCSTDEDKKKLTELLIPFDENLLSAHTVNRIRGKAAVGNIPEVEKEFKYAELVL